MDYNKECGLNSTTMAFKIRTLNVLYVSPLEECSRHCPGIMPGIESSPMSCENGQIILFIEAEMFVEKLDHQEGVVIN